MSVFLTTKPQSRFNLLINVLLCLMLLQLIGCSTAPVSEQPVEVSEVDPYENINRKVFVFNNTVDEYVAAPIAKAYKWVTPKFVQTGVFNFFNNLKDINVVLNDVMQAKFKQSAQDTGRFAINSTVGLLGLIDVAKEVGLEKHEEDFGQTLAVWGVPQGPYLVLPLIGPVTARGVPGGVFDAAANPATYAGMPIQLVSMLNTRANAEGALKFIDEAALDPYVFTREAFLQWRNNLAKDGNVELDESMLDLDDEFYEDETEQVSVDIEDTNKDVVVDNQEISSDVVSQEPEENVEGFKVKLSAEENLPDQTVEENIKALEAENSDGTNIAVASEVIDSVVIPENDTSSIEVEQTVVEQATEPVVKAESESKISKAKKPRRIPLSVEEALAAESAE